MPTTEIERIPIIKSSYSFITINAYCIPSSDAPSSVNWKPIWLIDFLSSNRTFEDKCGVLHIKVSCFVIFQGMEGEDIVKCPWKVLRH